MKFKRRSVSAILLSVILAVGMLACTAVVSLPAQAHAEAVALTGPAQTWITFTEAVSYDHSEMVGDTETDIYQVGDPIELNEAGEAIIRYDVAGGQKYVKARLRDEQGNLLKEDAGDSLTKNRTVTMTDLEPGKSYQLYWPRGGVMAEGGNHDWPERDVILTFTIKGDPEPIDISDYAAAVTPVKYTFNGKAKTPAVTVTGLTADDFTVSYENNTAIGQASAVITGIGAYTGTITKTFTIAPAKAKISKVGSGKKKLTVKIGKLKGGVKYQISVKQSGRKARLYNAGTKTRKVIKKLESKKKYTVKVRAYRKVSGKTYYGAWSKAKKAVVK